MMTWEGDNYVLIHQTAKFILKGAVKALSEKPTKYKTLEYLHADDPEDIFRTDAESSKAVLSNLDNIMKLLAFRAKRSAESAVSAF